MLPRSSTSLKTNAKPAFQKRADPSLVKETRQLVKGPIKTIAKDTVEVDFLPKISDEILPEFQFNIYADKAYFENDKHHSYIVFESYADEGVVFEVRSPNHPVRQKYISETFEVNELINDWNSLFPLSDAQPNAFINGFSKGGERKLLTLSLRDPFIEGNKIYFRYDLDQFDGNLTVKPGVIVEWDRKEPIIHVSIMIDGLQSIATSISSSFGNALSQAKSSVFQTIAKLSPSFGNKCLNSLSCSANLTAGGKNTLLITTTDSQGTYGSNYAKFDTESGSWYKVGSANVAGLSGKGIVYEPTGTVEKPFIL